MEYLGKRCPGDAPPCHLPGLVDLTKAAIGTLDLARASIDGFTNCRGLPPDAVDVPTQLEAIASDRHQRDGPGTAKELVEILRRLKGASMKVSQLASFIDAAVLPEEVCDVYQDIVGSLRDAAPPRDPDFVDQVFFAEFDTEPEGPSR